MRKRCDRKLYRVGEIEGGSNCYGPLCLGFHGPKLARRIQEFSKESSRFSETIHNVKIKF